MDGGDYDNGGRILSVKAAVNMYGEGISDGKFAVKKPSMDSSEESFSRTREFHKAKKDLGRFKESRQAAESDKAKAESELSNAKKAVRDLTLQIEETNSMVRSQRQSFGKLKKPERQEEERELDIGEVDDHHYAEVMKELELIKQDLSKVKLDMASVMEEKAQAEKEIEASIMKRLSFSNSAEALQKEIDEANEEHVLVELAKIEALKEFGAMKAQREKEADRYTSQMEETRKKMKGIIQEIDRAKEIENKLAVTTTDVNLLQNELKQVKEMNDRDHRSDSFSFQNGEESESTTLLQSVNEELEATKRELVTIRDEGFQFMASMDVIRDELKHVMEETARLKKTEEKAELGLQNINSKLLRAKSKLESVAGAVEKAKSILSNLSLTLEQLRTETEAARKEKELVCEETATIKEENTRTESEIEMNEEKLQVALQQLEKIKSSEAIALEKLKILSEETMRARASASMHSSFVTITNFEYEYLTGRATGAEEIADKKVAAAQAWIEAVKASEKETLMKTEIAQRQIKELKLEEERQAYRREKSPAKRVVDGRLPKWVSKNENSVEAGNMQLAVSIHRKSMKENVNLTPSRRPIRVRKSASPATRHKGKSPSITLKKKKKGMPDLSKLFSSKPEKGR